MIHFKGSAIDLPHGFFGRTGGVSTGLYESLNCAIGSNDNPDAIHENRARVATVLSGTLLTAYQHHSTLCVTVTESWTIDARPKVDAMATDVPGLALGILTADCAPVLFRGEKANGAPVIGVAHAGWRGALNGVTDATVAAMADLGARAETIRAVIGPCIGPESYEVSAEFAAPFNDAAFFRPGRQAGKLLFDLPAYVTMRLRRAGIGRVSWTGQDTRTAASDFFSYRRSTINAEPDYGRQVSAIVIPR